MEDHLFLGIEQGEGHPFLGRGIRCTTPFFRAAAYIPFSCRKLGHPFLVGEWGEGWGRGSGVEPPLPSGVQEAARLGVHSGGRLCMQRELHKPCTSCFSGLCCDLAFG